ncbi:MAG: oligosaccharide flippase family protein [Hyphomicrobiaceae bacterium]
MSPTMASRLVDRVRQILASQSSLFTNASAMAFGTIVSAGLGFVYWWFAARVFPAETVGIAAAVISIMNLCGLMGEFGLGTLLVGEIPKRKERAPGLVLASLYVAFVLSVICAVAVVMLCRWVAPVAAAAFGSMAVMVLFVVGCSLNGVTLTLDQAFVGMLRGTMQMTRNLAFAVIKLVLLGFAAWFSAGQGGPTAILASWVIGIFASIATLLVIKNEWRWRPLEQAPDWTGLRGLTRLTFDHHVLNLVTQAPGFLLPFLVAVTISPEANAAFFAAWMLVSVTLLIPAALTTVLFTIGRAEQARLPERLRSSLMVSIAVGLATAIGFLLFSRTALWLFNPRYPEIAGSSLQLLGFAVPAIAIKYHYIALKRIDDAMLSASFVLGIGGLAEVGFAAIGAYFGGLSGMTGGWLLACLSQAAYMAVPVLRVAFERKPATDGLRASRA